MAKPPAPLAAPDTVSPRQIASSGVMPEYNRPSASHPSAVERDYANCGNRFRPRENGAQPARSRRQMGQIVAARFRSSGVRQCIAHCAATWVSGGFRAARRVLIALNRNRIRRFDAGQIGRSAFGNRGWRRTGRSDRGDHAGRRGPCHRPGGKAPRPPRQPHHRAASPARSPPWRRSACGRCARRRRRRCG